MEEIASKFSLYDFFNPIFCGCMVVVGLHLMGCSPILYIIDSINTSGYEILNLLIILLLCLILRARRVSPIPFLFFCKAHGLLLFFNM